MSQASRVGSATRFEALQAGHQEDFQRRRPGQQPQSQSQKKLVRGLGYGVHQLQEHERRTQLLAHTRRNPAGPREREREREREWSLLEAGFSSPARRPRSLPKPSFQPLASSLNSSFFGLLSLEAAGGRSRRRQLLLKCALYSKNGVLCFHRGQTAGVTDGAAAARSRRPRRWAAPGGAAGPLPAQDPRAPVRAAGAWERGLLLQALLLPARPDPLPRPPPGRRWRRGPVGEDPPAGGLRQSSRRPAVGRPRRWQPPRGLHDRPLKERSRLLP